MPLVDSEGRMVGHFKSIEHFIDCHTRICPECGEERLTYEMTEFEICIYCQMEDEDVSD